MIFLVPKVSENDLVMTGGDLNGHVGKDVSGYDGIHGNFRYVVGDLEGENTLNRINF